jgi:hypothetical protein
MPARRVGMLFTDNHMSVEAVYFMLTRGVGLKLVRKYTRLPYADEAVCRTS